MAHIFFKRLEKRKSTQSFIPLNSFFTLEGLEQSLATSIQSQTRNLSQLFTTPIVPYGTFYSPWSPYSSYYTPLAPFGSSFFPLSSWFNPWSTWSSPWSYPWSTWSYPWSSWSTPWNPLPTTSWIDTTGSYPPGTLYGLVKRSNLKA